MDISAAPADTLAAPEARAALYRLAGVGATASALGASVALLLAGAPAVEARAFGGAFWLPADDPDVGALGPCKIGRGPTGAAALDSPETSCGAVAGPTAVLGATAAAAAVFGAAAGATGGFGASGLPAVAATRAPVTAVGVIKEEPARPPAGALIEAGAGAFRVAAVSRFRVAAARPAQPAFACTVETFSGGAPPAALVRRTEMIVSAGYDAETDVGLFGVVYDAAGATASPPATAGLAAGTMHGAGSRFATANLASRAVSVFELVRSAALADPPGADPQRVGKRLVATFAVDSAAAIMLSPNAATEDCGSLVVCAGSLAPLPGAAAAFPPVPLLTKVLTYGQTPPGAGGSVEYVEVALPVALAQNRAVLQAGVARYGNVLAVVSARASDYVSGAALDLYVEAPRGGVSGDAPGARREWVPAQRVDLDGASVPHPLVAYARATPAPAAGEVPGLFGFSYFGMSDSGLALAFFAAAGNLYCAVERAVFAPAPAPEPPASLRFGADGAALSMPALYSRRLSATESEYVRSYAAWLDARARGGLMGGGWRRAGAAGAVSYYAPASAAAYLRFFGVDVSDDARVATAQFATNMDFAAVGAGAALNEALPRNFFDVDLAGESAARRGPPALTDGAAVREGARAPGARLLRRFEFLS